MHLDDIRKVLRHCYNCQAESRPESAFRFGKIVAKRNHVFANYPGSSNDQGNESDKIPANGRKKKKGKGKQQEDQEQGNELEQNPYNCAKKKGKGRRREEQLRGLLKITQSEETVTPDENGTEDHESQQAPKPNKPRPDLQFIFGAVVFNQHQEFPILERTEGADQAIKRSEHRFYLGWATPSICVMNNDESSELTKIQGERHRKYKNYVF